MTAGPIKLPPEAVEAVQVAGLCQRHAGRHIHEIVNESLCPACVDGWLLAALPHLRCAILETELPRIVEMARGIGGSDGWTWHLGEPKEGWAHTPASILDLLTREG